MIREELFKKTCDILYQAYFNDTLQHGNCAACAVGNIIAANCGIKFKNSQEGCVSWDDDNGSFYNWYRFIFRSEYNYDSKIGEEHIASTGYSVEECILIENEFEQASYGSSEEDYMYNGLVAVLEVLKEIHQVTDEDMLPETMRFNNHYQMKTLTI